MTTTLPPANFTTKYNTTSSQCGCPNWRYFRSETGTKCKHQLVLENPSFFGNWMIWNPRDPSTYAYEGYANFSVYNYMENVYFFDFEEVKKYTNELAQRVLVVDKKDLRSNDILSFRNRNRYNTTLTSCDCFSNRNNTDNCKHIKRLKSLPKQSSIPNSICVETLMSGNTFLDQIGNAVSNAKASIQKEKDEFQKEKDDFRDKLGLCCVCYESKTLDTGCCKAKLCVDCWYNLDKMRYNKNLCPLCRSKIVPLVNVLMAKFKNFQK